jgi:hypothetical protein
MAVIGIELTNKYAVACWDCGKALRPGIRIVQGDDDHNYCLDCATYDGPDLYCSICDAECGGHY